MSQSVLKLSTGQIEKMKTFYKSNLKPKTPPGAVFSAKLEGCQVTAYRSGKVLFQGSQHATEAAKWGKVTSDSKAKPSSSLGTAPFAPPTSLFHSSHAGSDEAGTGDYFGPITVACAYVREDQINALKQAGVRDSKDLRDPQIQQIARKLIEMDIPYSLITLHNPKYNQLQQKGWSQGKMKTMLHHYAINNLLKKLDNEKPKGFIIDQFAEKAIYEKHLRTEKSSLQENVYFLKKAESHSIAVAAASIIARSAFVKYMDKLSERSGITIPKGASKAVDQAAASLIKKEGKEALSEYAKVHFANTDKAMKLFHKM